MVRKVSLGTTENAEITIDYEMKTADFGGIPKDTFFRRLSLSFFYWIGRITLYFAGIIFVLSILWILTKIMDYNILSYFFIFTLGVVAMSYFILIPGLTLYSLDIKVDKKIKSELARRSILGYEKNKIKVTRFYDKKYMIPNFKNLFLQYISSGDVSRQLIRVETREEEIQTLLQRGADIEAIKLKEYRKNEQGDEIINKVWNAYFIFREIPKDGTLEVEFI